MNKPIPVNTPLLSGNELKYVTECIETGWISSEGPFIHKFETAFADYIGRQHSIAVSNGTAALDIAVAALDIGPGDEVIMPTFTIISPALQVVRAGAKPILVDSDPKTWNMDVTQIEAKITNKTRAIIVVHIYGLPVDMDPVLDLCKKYNLKLIEDAAEVHGQTYKGRKCGTFGDISTFSFYPNKHITTGEGGMIMTDDENLAARCRILRNLGFEPDKPRFVHYVLGWNYRMTNMQAALGLAQLEKIEEHIAIKQKIGSIYQNDFKDLKGFQLPLPQTDYAENIYWVFGLVADTTERKEAMIKHLNECHIGTRPFFWCLHEQPVLRKKGWYIDEIYPVAENLARSGFYIPSGLGINENEVSIVSKCIINA
jgi:perosamine synthetase